MADTTFTDGVTLTAADFFNDINRLHYTLLQDPSAVHFACDGRITLTTATPVTTADVTGATTIYFTPYKGGKISLYDGSTNWKTYTFTELSLAVPATTDTMYDVYCYANAGTPTLELTAWTNDTTRATALTKQNGVYVKTGATTRRYLGSFRTTGVSGQTEDSVGKRYVWNYYNRVLRRMVVTDSTNTWTYSTATLRQANNNAANQLDLVQGVVEDVVTAKVVSTNTNDTGTGVLTMVGIGVDSTTVDNSLLRTGGYMRTANEFSTPTAELTFSFTAAGRHTLVWLEYAVATGTTTWYGDNGTVIQSGIIGEVMG